MTDAVYRGTGSLEHALANGARLLDRDPRAAAAQAKEILQVDPEQADALRLLGAALRRLDRNEEAERAEVDAIKASSHNPVLVKAAQAITANRLNESEHLLRPYLARKPDDAAAQRLLAEIAARVGALDDAEQLLRNALRLAPGFRAARSRLAQILFQKNRLPESLAVLDELLAREPEDAVAQGSKAATLSRIGDYGEALALYAALLERTPGKPRLWMSYGHILNTVGRADDSVAAYRQAITLAPAFGEGWWSLANLKTATLDDKDIAQMTEMVARDDLDDEDRFHLHFALGKALEDARRYEASLAHYAEGNRIRRGMIGYSADAHSALVRRSEALFTPAFFEARRDFGCPAPDPIFVLGMPRAGSTLVEQILSSHSMIEGTSELPHIPSLTRRLEAELAEGAAYPDFLANLDPAGLSALGEEYLAAARLHRKTDKPFFIDKLPNNWINIGFILMILPNAKIVDARRHPLGCCFSNFKQHFARGQGFSYSLDDLGRYYRDYVGLMRHFDTVMPGRIHRVLHEAVVEDTEGEVRRLLDYLGLPFEAQCLRFYENERAVRTPSAGQVRQPINRAGVEGWRPFEPGLGPLKDALGPVLDCYPDAPAD